MKMLIAMCLWIATFLCIGGNSIVMYDRYIFLGGAALILSAWVACPYTIFREKEDKDGRKVQDSSVREVL